MKKAGEKKEEEILVCVCVCVYVLGWAGGAGFEVLLVSEGLPVMYAISHALSQQFYFIHHSL